MTAYREQTVEIALGPKGAFENGNFGTLTRRVPTDGVGTPSGFPQASDRDGMQVLSEGEARLPVIEHDTGGIEDALRVGLYMVRGPAATSRLRADPAQEPKVRYLAKGTVPDHGEERGSSGHRDYDYLEWIARLTSHIPDRGTQLVHYCGAYSNAHRGIAHRRKAFVEVPPEDEPPGQPRMPINTAIPQ